MRHIPSTPNPTPPCVAFMFNEQSGMIESYECKKKCCEKYKKKGKKACKSCPKR